jgi:hypothetical protein
MQKAGEIQIVEEAFKFAIDYKYKELAKEIEEI